MQLPAVVKVAACPDDGGDDVLLEFYRMEGEKRGRYDMI